LATALAFIGVILPLIYTVRLIQKLLFQEARQPLLLSDLNQRELAVMALLALGAFYLGLHPTPLLDMLKVPVSLLIVGMP
jgi:NADH-quinone oxidoreductase subunit M